MGLKDEGWRLDPAAYPLRLTVPTRYADMDANAHLNNVAIARLVEESRVRFHYAIRDKGGAVSPGGIMIVHVAIDYLGEGEYPADVDAGVGIVSVGQSSYRLAIGLFQHGRAFALAQSVMVAMAADRSGSMPIGPDLRSRLEQYGVAA